MVLQTLAETTVSNRPSPTGIAYMLQFLYYIYKSDLYIQQHYTIVCTYPTTPQPCAHASMSELVDMWSPLIYVSAAEGTHLGSLSDFTRHLPQQKRNDISCWTTAVRAILNQRNSLSATSNSQQTSFPDKWCLLYYYPERGWPPPLRPFPWTVLKYNY